jgi:hypothetical protein
LLSITDQAASDPGKSRRSRGQATENCRVLALFGQRNGRAGRKLSRDNGIACPQPDIRPRPHTLACFHYPCAFRRPPPCLASLQSQHLASQPRRVDKDREPRNPRKNKGRKGSHTIAVFCLGRPTKGDLDPTCVSFGPLIDASPRDPPPSRQTTDQQRPHAAYAVRAAQKTSIAWVCWGRLLGTSFGLWADSPQVYTFQPIRKPRRQGRRLRIQVVGWLDPI